MTFYQWSGEISVILPDYFVAYVNNNYSVDKTSARQMEIVNSLKGRAKEVIQVVRGTENPNKMTVLDRISLDRALKQLPPGYRSVFVLHDVEGHEHGEKILGVAVGTSKSQLYKARMKLRQMLKQSLDVLVPDRLETLLPNLGGQVYSE